MHLYGRKFDWFGRLDAQVSYLRCMHFSSFGFGALAHDNRGAFSYARFRFLRLFTRFFVTVVYALACCMLLCAVGNHWRIQGTFGTAAPQRLKYCLFAPSPPKKKRSIYLHAACCIAERFSLVTRIALLRQSPIKRPIVLASAAESIHCRPSIFGN